ncbi:MAG: ABC transporter permease, partial [bacterium]|nr:ABC transporter permease [bacterium]
LTGNNPLAGYFHLFRGGLMSIERIGNSLASATPLIFTGLAVAFAFKTGLFNIGASGQMLIGGLCATAIGLTFAWPKPLLLTVMILFSALGGAAWAAFPGWLKAKFNVHEVVATIMMNWIAFWTIYYVIPAYFKGPFLETESRKIPYEASLRVEWLTSAFKDSYVNLGLLLAIAAVVGVAFILNRTTLGYELKAVGINRFAAEAAGINVNRRIILAMAISGALAGLAGTAYYAGYAVNMQIGVLPSHGFDGIAVALLGASAPWGVFGGAIFFGILHTGKGFMNAMTNIPPMIADTIIATMIYFAATSILMEKQWDKYKKRKTSRAGGGK